MTPWPLATACLATHALSSLSSRHRDLVASHATAAADGRVVWQAPDEVCVHGHVTYAELREAWPDDRAVPTPSCDQLSVLGHLVSDGHGRLAHREVWLRDVVTRVRLDDGAWRPTPTPAAVLDAVLGASRGLVRAACLNASAWAAPFAAYGLAQRVTRVTEAADADVAAASVAWLAGGLAVLETSTDPDGRRAADWSVRLSATFADLPGVTALTRLLPAFYDATALLRGVVVVSGRLTTERTPNPVLAPCTVRAEDAEVRVPWRAWAAAWRAVADAAQARSCSLIVKRGFDRAWPDDDVAIVDVQASVGREAAVDEVVQALCERAPRCALHVGKSAPPSRARETFRAYYSDALGVPALTQPPARCLHPFCARDGVARVHDSVRPAPRWWLF